jgi:hypothetical protein
VALLYHLKIFYVDADENPAPDAREVKSAADRDCNWMTSMALNRALADSVLIVRMRASWSSRG